jgi:hypothetical protein
MDTEIAFKKTIEPRIKYKKGVEKEQRRKDAQSNNVLEFIQKDCIPIEINVTPLCDIVQNKFIHYRVITGFIAPLHYYECIKKNDLAFFYKSPKFSLNGKEMFIGLDLRTFSSFSKEEIDKKDYFFSLRTNLINDIQTKLSAHVSRLGVLYL